MQLMAQTGDSTHARDNVNAVLYMQHAGEYRALAFQAYNMARIALDTAIRNKKKDGKPLAVVVDIDETILNNSPYGGEELRHGRFYTVNTWNNWVNKAEADTIPGACAFLKYAAMRGAVVFYVTNRNQAGFDGTLRNLQRYGFPDADAQHLWVSKGDNNKAARRQQIGKEYDIALLCGDDLNDFSDVFYGTTENQRNELVDKMWDDFGKRFIVLPNPTYGDWEDVLYPQGATEARKAAIRLQQVKGYK